MALDKLLELVALNHLRDGFSVDRVTLVVVQLVPLFRHISCPEQDFLVARVVRVLQVFIVFLLKTSFCLFADLCRFYFVSLASLRLGQGFGLVFGGAGDRAILRVARCG